MELKTWTLRDVQTTLNATVLSGEEWLDRPVKSVCGSDLMSDVLAYVKDQGVLLTGLVNPQVIRTADMMDMKCVVFVRDKMPDEMMLELAHAREITVMRSSLPLFRACGILYSSGLTGENA